MERTENDDAHAKLERNTGGGNDLFFFFVFFIFTLSFHFAMVVVSIVGDGGRWRV